MRHILLLGLAIFCMFQTVALAAVPASKDLPTTINAQKMVYNAEKQQVNFSGKVHVVRPDLEIWSDELTVFVDGEKASSSEHGVGTLKNSSINKIIAKGSVRLKSGEREGQSQKATFFVKENKFVMEGSPKLKEKQNTIKGDTIVHYLNENRSEVHGGKNGVEATFMAPDTSKNEIIPNVKK